MVEVVQEPPAIIPPRPDDVREDRQLLEGPRSRTAEFFRVLRIMREFICGFRHLHFLGPCISVFGSARFQDGHRYYQLARQIGAEIARLGFTVLTGGGQTIDPGDFSRFVLTDSVAEVIAQLERCPSKPHGWQAGRVESREWELKGS